MPQIQPISHQRARRPHACLHPGTQLGGSKLQHLRGALPTQLLTLLSTRQRLLNRRLTVGIMQIRPMRRKLYELAFMLQHQPVRLPDQRQGGRRVRPTTPAIEHKFILEEATDTFEGWPGTPDSRTWRGLVQRY